MLRAKIFIAFTVGFTTLAFWHSPASATVTWSNTGSGVGPFAFDTASNWTATTYATPPTLGPELTPPKNGSLIAIDAFTGTVQITQPQTGANALGALAVGLGNADQVSELVISADVDFTGLERAASGEYNTTLRHIRVGRDDQTTTDSLYPWGVVRQTAGTVNLNMHLTTVTDPDGDGPAAGVNPQIGRAELLLSSDKDASAGSIWEVGGTASLFVPDELRVGDRQSVTTMPGSVFRVRGSDVGQVMIGGTGAGVQRYKAVSRAGLWSMDQPGGSYGTAVRTNLGKSITEFVLDSGGVTPITVSDRLELAEMDIVPGTGPLATTIQRALSFMRIKLSEPTAAGTGSEKIVLFKADRIASVTNDGQWVDSGTEYDQGRFFDPDRDGPNLSMTGLTPHRRMWENDDVIAEYAGATYTWKIHYNNDSDDGNIVDSVWLDELVVTGTPGDLNGVGGVTSADRDALIAAIATPPKTHYQLLGAAQNKFDLNADDYIDNNDLALFNSIFLPPTGTPGDFNNNGKVDAADYTIWRNNLGQPEGNLLNGNGNGGTIDQTDYALWKTNFGSGGSGALASAAVPEPSSILMVMLCVAGVVGLRRRAA